MSRIPRTVLAGLAAVTLARLVIAAHFPLGDDEAYYWDWSRHLAAGYVDHPPAIAYLIRVSTDLLGLSPFAVHAVPVLLSLVTALGVWTLAREVLSTDAAAAWAVALFVVTPVFAAGALLAAPDAPLGVAWVFALLWSWRAARRPLDRGPAAWLAAGAWVGLGLLSKYAAAVLPLSVGLWLVLSPRLRPWLRRPAPYAGLALAAAIFSPVVWWNATHRWASFAFTLSDGPDWRMGGDPLAFLALQFVYLAPLLFPVLLWSLARAASLGLRGDEARLFLAAAGFPLIGIMAAASVVGHVKAHWPAPGYIAAILAMAGLLAGRPWRARSPVWRLGLAVVLGTTLALTVFVYALPAVAPAVLPPRLDPTLDYYGWREAAQAVVAVAHRDARGPFVILSDRYQMLAQFDFMTGARYPATTLTGRDQYNIWAPWDALRGQDGLFIEDARYPLQVDLRSGCRTIEPEPPIRILRGGVEVRRIGLTWCRDFVGHPIPLRR